VSTQPRVSILVPAYRQEKFIREAVQSALAQTYESLEIVLSDDASPDRTFEIMAEEVERYKGPHRLILHRNPKNLGLAGNLNRAVQLASGDLFIQQDGDDISVPTRTSKLVERWVGEHPRRDLVYSNAIRIAADGRVLQHQKTSLPIATLEEVARGRFFIAGAAVSAYSRSLFEKFGPLNPTVVYTDYVLTFRALLGTGCALINEPLVYYRLHEGSITHSTAKSGNPRLAAAQWAKHVVAEEEDRIRALDLSKKSIPRLRRRLTRNVAYARLNERSSTGSRLTALGCCIVAIGNFRPNAAWLFFRRDILNSKLG
jgi:glycosyltransferase involved in cell wall biosynthesis